LPALSHATEVVLEGRGLVLFLLTLYRSASRLLRGVPKGGIMRKALGPVTAIGVSIWLSLTGEPRLFAAEPHRVEGGDASIDGSFLGPYTNRWTFSIQKPVGPPVEAGTWSDTMEWTTYRGRRALKRTQIAEYKKGPRLTFVNVFDPRSMASYSFDYSRSDNGETRHLEIRDRTATFRRSPGSGDDPAQQYVATVDHGILDYYDGLYGILLDAFPLREGFETAFPAFDTDRASLDWIQLTVTGRETVEAGSGKTADTWVVHVETKRYGSSTWWLTREAPYVIKAKLVLPETDGGATITYSMI
jgi:hypothetical protein